MEEPEPRNAVLENFGLLAQPDASTCGITTIGMVKAFLSGQAVDPKALSEKYGLTGGITAAEFTGILSKELPAYRVTYKSGLGDGALVGEIHAQLARGLPVPVFFGAPDEYNKPWWNFHASAVTAIDPEAQTVGIANAYGYAETLPLGAFLDRMRYGDLERYPPEQRMLLALGIVDVNAMVVLERV